MRPKITESVLQDYFNRELSSIEEEEILAWKDACEENRELYERVRKEHLLLRWAVRAELIKGDYSSISSRMQERATVRPTFRLWHRMAAVAASVAVIAISSIFLTDYFNGESLQTQVAEVELPANTAILELSDGSIHSIGVEGASLKEQNGTRLAINGGELVYDKGEQKENKKTSEQENLIYNKVIVPRGTGQYRVILADGSTVWLNSDSRFEYPVDFTENERRVRISGEAYFEVARDETRPFIVETDSQDIFVLGTKFNVTAYPSEPIFTTLASGSVKVVPAGRDAKEVILSPGEQSVLNVDNGSLAVHKVSVSNAISWKDGITSIENYSLEQALTRVSRLYDVDFDISGLHQKNIILRGSLPNDECLDVVLSVLSKVANVKFKMNADGKIKVEE